MNISLNWLTDYVDVASIPAEELGERCMHIGLNLEEIVSTDSDIVLDLEVTSNRPDCLCHLGVAREVAAALGLEYRPPVLPDLPATGSAAELASVEVLAPDLCPRYTARIIRGVKVGPSPSWMVERLAAVGVRSVNNIVDVTNYVLFEYAQPLHSFDFDKLDGRRIIVRRAEEGELLVSIDETKCKLTPDMLVIADAARPVAIAGVMGGLNTEVTEGTANVLLEAAQFDPLSIRHTSRKLQLMSESNYRFERGIDPVRLEEASRRACQLILELAGGELAEGLLDVWAEPWQAPTVKLRPERTDKLLGYEIPPERQVEILDRLGLSPRMDGGKIACTIPSHRADLTREADLIEEVARLAGYDRIPVYNSVEHPVRPMDVNTRARRDVGRVLNAAGFDEAMTYTFIDREEAERFGFADVVNVDPLVRKTNNTLRPTLAPALLRAVKTNQDAGNGAVSLYEIAAVFPFVGAGELPGEYVELGLVTTRELRELRGALEAVVEKVDPGSRLELVAKDLAGLQPGAAAELLLDGEPAGRIGMISAEVQDACGLEKPAAVASLHFEALLSRAGAVRTYRPLAKFPGMQRDLSILVDEDVTWRRIEQTVLAVDQPMRESLAYVTTYRGKQIPAGRKSVTLTLTYRKPDGTLRGEEADAQVAQVVESLKKTLSAELRT